MGKNNKKLAYEMDGKKLKQVKEEKDLGVLVDDELNFHKQTSSAIKKANGVLVMMKKSFSAFDDTNLAILYKTLVRPRLEYGNVVWGSHYKEDIEAIEKIQRRATKMVPRLKNMSCEERLRQLKIPSLAQRRRRGDMIFTYKLITGQMNITKTDFFKMSNLSQGGHST